MLHVHCEAVIVVVVAVRREERAVDSTSLYYVFRCEDEPLVTVSVRACKGVCLCEDE